MFFKDGSTLTDKRNLIFIRTKRLLLYQKRSTITILVYTFFFVSAIRSFLRKDLFCYIILVACIRNAGEVNQRSKNVAKIRQQELNRTPLKNLSAFLEMLLPYITQLNEVSFSTGTFPNCLKLARVAPVFRSGTRTCPRKYRPISVLPVYKKNFERAFHKRLEKFFDKIRLLNEKNFVFRPHRRTIKVLAGITMNRRLSSQRMEKYFVLLDSKEASHHKNTPTLPYEVGCFERRGFVLTWSKSYFHNRRQYVFVDQIRSRLRKICGVLQGSIPEPLLFTIFINEVPSICRVFEPFLLADDTELLLQKPSRMGFG